MKSELHEILIAVALFAFLAAMGLARLTMREAYVAKLPPCTAAQMATARESFAQGFEAKLPTCQPLDPQLATP